MGYTHYWEAKPLKGKKLAEVERRYRETGVPALRALFARFAGLLAREFDRPDEPPQADERVVAFNGIGEDGHETFYVEVDKLFRDGKEFGFCKTARKPYDAAVCAALLILGRVNPEMGIGSDGFTDRSVGPPRVDHGTNWLRAVQIAAKILGELESSVIGGRFVVDVESLSPAWPA
jgi:hypothetical protein